MLTLETAQITQGSFTLHADLTLAPAQTYAVIGPSGAGKSTLLGALCGFMSAQYWQAAVAGHRHHPSAPGARPMTMLFQDNNLFPHLSVMQNVGLGLRPDLRLSTAEQTRVHEALDRVGLRGWLPANLPSLSGGQQSRVALARVLVQARPLVLLDEPFAALGPALRNDMLDLVAGSRRRNRRSADHGDPRPRRRAPHRGSGDFCRRWHRAGTAACRSVDGQSARRVACLSGMIRK